MGYSKEEMIARISQLIVEKAGIVAREEITAFEKANPSVNLPNELQEKVIQRAGSELLFRMNYFKDYEEGISDENLVTNFESWYLLEEDEKLRRVCQGNIKDLLSKMKVNEDDGLSFTERFLKKVRTEGRTQSTVEIMNGLNTK